jgi:deazaflavin-dependent oxidoreductase (nitroreductase family)
MSEHNMVDTNRQVIAEFRANRGEVLTGRFAGSKLLLLTTHGAKTNQERVNPMMFVQDGEDYVVFASHRGAPTSPDWYYNLVAHADVTVEVGPDRFEGLAIVTSGDERQRLWDKSVALHPFLADLQATALPRVMPVVVLRRT